MLESGPVSGGAWRLLCSWDFSVVNEKAIQNNKNNLGIQLKVHTCSSSSSLGAFRSSSSHFFFQESLSERLQMKRTTSVSERMKYLSLHLLAWLLSLGLAVGSCAGIYFLGIDQLVSLQAPQSQQIQCASRSRTCVLQETSSLNHDPNDLTAEASTLLLPVVVSLINLIVPLLYSLISRMERYSNPRAKIYISITRCDHCLQREVSTFLG